MSTSAPSGRQVDIADRLRSAWNAPGPFLSAIVPTEAVWDQSRADIFAGRAADLASLGANDAMIDAMAARLGLPAPDDAGGLTVWVAHDGTTVVDFGADPPGAPIFRVGELPDVSAALEWAQARSAHITAAVSPGLFELVVFPIEGEPSVAGFTELTEAVERCRAVVTDQAIELIVIGGSDSEARALHDALVHVVPPSCVVQVAEGDEASTGEALADATVRRVADQTARRSVEAIRAFRFLEEHDEAVDGVESVIAALASGSLSRVTAPATLLIHGDPSDSRLCYFGHAPTDIALEPSSGCPTAGRLVDAAIRSAMLQDARVRIIPSTGEQGPADDIALTLPTVAL